MKKIRTLSFGIVLAAGMAMFGTGIAAADETPPADVGTEDPATTGSADGLAELLKALTTGSAGAEEPADVDTVADEVPPATGDEATTGSADGIAELLKALTTGSAAEETPAETDAA